MQKTLSILLLCALPALIGACCSARRCQNAGAAVAQYQFRRDSIEAALGARPGAAPSRIDMLVLSGGGSHGAWGAGVLRGWRENPTNPRPAQFKVVTGVSTGALLATYAFLGEPADDDLLERAYTTVKTSDIYRKKCLPLALFSDSLMSSKPLWHTVEKYLTSETLERVARAGRDEHRRLYVGTVNLDTGRLVIWDLTAIAMDDSNPQRLDLYRQVVFASASIPIMVPPVQLDGNLHADGGARAQLFFERDFFPALRDLRARRALQPELTLHVIVNGKLGVAPACVSDCLKAIALRTLELVLDANAIGDLYRLKYVLDSQQYGRFRLCYIPPDFEVTTSDVFDPVMMHRLYDAGAHFGRTTVEWTNSIPPLDLAR